VADEAHDPRVWDGKYTPIDDPNPRYVSEEWGVEGWNDSGGGVMMRGEWGATLQGAIERAEKFELAGDVDGRKYEHVAVVKFQWRTCCKTEHSSLDEARQML
jgi:hypothetical protein